MKSSISNFTAIKFFLACVALTCAQPSYALCGAVNYSQTADALAEAVTFLCVMAAASIDIVFAVSAIFAIVSAVQIYIKINNQEGDIKKSIMMLVGAILFLIGSTVVMPAFYGFDNITFNW